MFIVYKLTNSVNGKAYIGVSGRSLETRWGEHTSRRKRGMRSGNRLYAAMDKYGVKVFSREIVAAAFTEDEARHLEREYILKFDTYDRGYNSNLGGHGFLRVPDHIRRRIGEAQKGKVISAESRAKMSLAKLGDRRQAINLGRYVNKGADSPAAGKWLVRFPDGTEHAIVGIMDFCRRNKLHRPHFATRGKSKGYVLLRRLND